MAKGGADRETVLGSSIVAAFVVDFTAGVLLCVAASMGNDHQTPLVFHVADARGGAKLVSLPSEWNLVYVLGLGPHVAAGAWKLWVSMLFIAAKFANTRGARGVVDDSKVASSSGSRGPFVSRLSKMWDKFVVSVCETTNFFRWMEYALCAPMCALVASLCGGSRDLHFLLSQMVLAVSVVVVAFEQERKTDGKPVSWTPAVVAGGLFACQWTLAFWQAHAADSGTVLPGVLFVVGVSVGFVAQTYASRGYGDGKSNIARVKNWGLEIVGNASKKNDDATADATGGGVGSRTDRALKVETAWTFFVVCGKVLFSVIVLYAVVPGLPTAD